MGLYEENLKRLHAAVRCEPVDRIPVVPCGTSYMARVGHVLMKDYINDPLLACDTNLKELKRIEADATQNVVFSPYVLGTHWLSKTAMPGVELGDDEAWQVMEEPDNMTFEDYAAIREMGWEAWEHQFIAERCNDNFAKLAPLVAAKPEAYRRFYQAGLPTVCDFVMVPPFELFCGGRSLVEFLTYDLIEHPDVVLDTINLVLEHNLKQYRDQILRTHPTGVWIGGWRSGPAIVSPAMFDEFTWPSFKAYYELCIDTGIMPVFHLDSDWTLVLDRFKAFKEGTYVMGLDSKTDIRKCREILGPNVCILGDVPCEMLAFGTPDDVKHYVTSLLDDIGPWGVMIASGCDLPSNARPENVKAMSDAAHGYLK